MRRILVSNVRKANHVSEKESGEGTKRFCFIRLRVLRRCLALRGAAYLTVYCSLALCIGQTGEVPGVGAWTAQSAAVAGLTKRPVTVADSIRMTRLGDVRYTGGAPSKGIVAKFSPDGKHFVVILKKGNLQANTNEYSLVLFPTGEVFQSPDPQVLVSLASSSNRPAIDNVLWLDDNDTILFLGESPGERTALYSLKCSSKELRNLTNHATNLTSFSTTASAKLVVYTAKNPASTFLTESIARKGFAVSNQPVTDLIRGSYGGNDYDDDSLFIKHLGQDAPTRIAAQGRISGLFHEMSLSPDGAHLLIQTEATDVSDTWSEYEDQFLKLATRHAATKGGHTNIFQYELVDTV